MNIENQYEYILYILAEFTRKISKNIYRMSGIKVSHVREDEGRDPF